MTRNEERRYGPILVLRRRRWGSLHDIWICALGFRRHRDCPDRVVSHVHFATHGLKQGELDCDSPPALITSIGDDPQSDGLLSFEEIANLQFDANLVVLSACNTAAETRASRASGTTGFRAGRAGQGATLNGLVRAFLVAGSRTVVTTYWAIPDGFKTRDGRQVAASTQLIETFFKTGLKQSIAGSMRAAQPRQHLDRWTVSLLSGSPTLTRGSGRCSRRSWVITMALSPLRR
ncbi:CHAT domain-containing protein [Glacieibacterium sp.]|uniref:CHAT domain-containing protein n=1 Tax=Glacieibacterium sp. TaxID=2860237 RepID=UPI003B00E443